MTVEAHRLGRHGRVGRALRRSNQALHCSVENFVVGSDHFSNGLGWADGPRFPCSEAERRLFVDDKAVVFFGIFRYFSKRKC